MENKKETKLNINGKEIVVKKMPLGQYAQLLSTLDQLPPEVTDEFVKLDLQKPEAFLAKLPKLLAKSFPSFVKLLSIATGVDEATLNSEYGIHEAIELVKAVFEVNEFNQIKNDLVAIFQKKAPATPVQKIG